VNGSTAATSRLTIIPGSSHTGFTAGTSGNPNGVAFQDYEYFTDNQVGFSDITQETFNLNPTVVLSTTNQVDTGTILAGASLWPSAEAAGTCVAPFATTVNQPRFVTKFQSGVAPNGPSYIGTNSMTDPLFSPYAFVNRCSCFLLFTYITKDSFFNTGLAIANTTGDDQVFGTAAAPNQSGPITFFFYDKAIGYVGQTVTTGNIGPGQSFVGLASQILPTGVTSFSGYVIAQTAFQFCHGFAFIADSNFATIAQGYIASVIPDPAIKGGRRQPAAAADVTNLPAGESLNN
jgi:hypothetical protein